MTQAYQKSAKNAKSSFRKAEARLGILLLLPTLILIGAVVIYPIIYNFYLSFHDVALNPNRPNEFEGFENYLELFQDSSFYQSLGITVLYVFCTVLFSTLVGLGIALLMNKPFRGRKLARSLMLFSYVAPVVGSVYAWQYMFNGLYGVINYFTVDQLHWFQEAPLWFDQPLYAFILVVLFDVWRVFPYSFMMILASLQSIDTSLYEACDVDGAGAWLKFRAVTLPEIMPAIGAIVTLRTIWNFYKFDDIFLFTNQVPTIGVYLYRTAFSSNDYGLASAITIILFVIVFSFVVFLGRKVLKR